MRSHLNFFSSTKEVAVKRIARGKSVAQGERAWWSRDGTERARAQVPVFTPGKPSTSFAWAAAPGQPTQIPTLPILTQVLEQVQPYIISKQDIQVLLSQKSQIRPRAKTRYAEQQAIAASFSSLMMLILQLRNSS